MTLESNELESISQSIPLDKQEQRTMDVLVNTKVNFFIQIQELNELIAFAKSKRKFFWLKYGSAARKTDKDINQRIQGWQKKIKELKRYGILFNTM